MKKFTKLFAVISSAVMLFSLLGTTPVTAAETTEKLYTLSELMEMSDEEFLALEGAEDICNNIRDVLKEIQEFKDYFVYENETQKPEAVLNGEFRRDIVLPSEDYTANMTEKKISKVLGDETDYRIISPLDNEELIYDNSLIVSFNDYIGLSPTEENIINVARCGYCINQIIDLPFENPYYAPESNTEDFVMTGDVNLDKAVDLYDVIWIASDLADIFKLTDGQQRVGDVNEDGVCDLYDAIEIAKNIMQ